jgi:hypothetical protein
VLLEECQRFPKSGGGGGQDAVQTELMSYAADLMTSVIVADRGHQCYIVQPNSELRCAGAKVKDLSSCNGADEEAARLNHVAGHPFVGPRVDQVAVRLDCDGGPRPAEV